MQTKFHHCSSPLKYFITVFKVLERSMRKNLELFRFCKNYVGRIMLTQPPILQIANQLIDFYEVGILFITG